MNLVTSVFQTTRCNRGCWFCMFSSTPCGLDMRLEDTKRTADVLSELKSQYPEVNLEILLTGGGENLLLKDLPERVELFSSIQPNMLRMITSGVNSDEEGQRFLDVERLMVNCARYSIMVSVHQNKQSYERLRKTLEIDPYYLAVTMRMPNLHAWEKEMQMSQVIRIIKEFGYQDDLWYGHGPVAARLGQILLDEDDEFELSDLEVEEDEIPFRFYGTSRLVHFKNDSTVLVNEGEIGNIGRAVGKSNCLYPRSVNCSLFCENTDAYARFEPGGFKLCTKGGLLPYSQLTAELLAERFERTLELKQLFGRKVLSGQSHQEACASCPLYAGESMVVQA